MTATPNPAWSAIVLAGGGGTRLGGIDKATMQVGDRTMLEHILTALPDDIGIVVSGRERPTSRPVQFSLEEPPDGGPVAGLAAALPLVRTTVVVVIAVDMPWVGPVLPRLVDAVVAMDSDAALAVDEEGHRQVLCSAWRTASLSRALNALGDSRDRAMRELFDMAVVTHVSAPTAELHDVDNPADLQRARSGHGGPGTSPH